MDDPKDHAGGVDLDAVVALARDGDRPALEQVVRAIQPDVHRLALRFLWHPDDAEDATQEILVRVVTRLASFRGESAFRTWVYRVATNALLSMKRGRAEQHAMSLDAFADDLDRGLADVDPGSTPAGRSDGGDHSDHEHPVERAVLLEEVKVGCTLAMLLGLDRDRRIAYILGEILELDHREAAEVLGIEPAAFRKRLSRARADITGLMRARCGLFDPANRCRCHRRLDTAIDLGRVDPDALLFASPSEQVRRFPQVLDEIRALGEAGRARALYRTNQSPAVRTDYAAALDRILGG